MKIVTIFGAAYSVTETNYKKLMNAISKDASIDMSKYGKYLCNITNITDMSPDEATDILEDMRRNQF